MATDPFEPPPRIVGRVDENGNIIITQEEWQKLMDWLWRLVKHIASIT